MNILALADDPHTAARYHHTVHVRSQAGEAHQVFSDALCRLGIVAAQARHPYNRAGRFARWCAMSRANAAWLVDLGLALCHEHVIRCGTTHAAEVALLELAPLLARFPDDVDRTPFAMDKATASIAAELSLDPIAAYRRRYVAAKLTPRGIPASWAPHDRPAWIHQAA